MGQSSNTLHEDEAKLSPATIDRHRAIVSLMEELEAVDWYDQRVDAASDDELRAILAHNRDEEKEHAMMVLEWLRRNDATFDEMIRTYLLKSGSIVGHEESATGGNGAGNGENGESGGGNASGGSLGIGSLK